MLRVYTDLVGESAKRGELPAAEHLAALARELSLMESLVGRARARAPIPVPARAPAPGGRSELVAILSTLVESYRAAHGSRIRLEFVAEAPEIPVGADPVALQRAFRNVLDNAVKYTPSGGQVRVRASVVSQHAFVVISDTGGGMTPEEQKHAFTPAWRSPSAVASGIPGRGIGLGVTKELLEQNGGKISLLSEAGPRPRGHDHVPALARGPAREAARLRRGRRPGDGRGRDGRPRARRVRGGRRERRGGRAARRSS